MTAAAPAELRSVTALRFAAAFWVFVFHIDIRWPLAVPGLVSGLIKQGAAGMSLFFILSGFVLTYAYVQRGVAGSGYLRHRFARIYPVYTLAALTTLPFFAEQAAGLGGRQLAFVVLGHVLMLQAWFPALAPLWNFGASWSLSVEAFLYAVFPLALGRLQALGDRALLAVAAGCYVLSVLPGWSYLLFPGSPPIYYSVPIFRLPEFLLGVIAALLFLRGRRLGPWVAVAAVAVLSVFLGKFAVRSDIYVTGNAVVVPCLVAVIWALASLDARRPSAGAAPLVYLGRISYAFYSMQPLVIGACIRWQQRHATAEPALVLVTACVALTVVSAVVYHLVEEPLRRRLGRPWARAA